MAKQLFQLYQKLSNTLNIPNGEEEKLAQLVWNTAYHITRMPDSEAYGKSILVVMTAMIDQPYFDGDYVVI